MLSNCQLSGDCLVQLGMSDVLSVLGLMLALAVQTWAIMRFMISRMDGHSDKQEEKIAAIHTRINEVKDQYVKRTDIDRDLAQMNRSIADVNQSLNMQMTGVNTRLDTIIHAIGKNPAP